jgi:hypothetical protein
MIGMAKRNIFFSLIALFACVAIGFSIYLDSTREREDWNIPVASSSSTPTAAFIPAEGWWESVSSPTPKP